MNADEIKDKTNDTGIGETLTTGNQQGIDNRLEDSDASAVNASEVVSGGTTS